MVSGIVDSTVGTVEVLVVETAGEGIAINIIWDALEPHSTTVTYPIQSFKVRTENKCHWNNNKVLLNIPPAKYFDATEGK